MEFLDINDLFRCYSHYIFRYNYFKYQIAILKSISILYFKNLASFSLMINLRMTNNLLINSL